MVSGKHALCISEKGIAGSYLACNFLPALSERGRLMQQEAKSFLVATRQLFLQLVRNLGG